MTRRIILDTFLRNHHTVFEEVYEGKRKIRRLEQKLSTILIAMQEACD